ncbi:hypothetical protein DRP07_02205 [Archaeoglobales archaeon]|nr:MAG: hypothetical protein DRP07_02205 [Archaeoglobales archaeon]
MREIEEIKELIPKLEEKGYEVTFNESKTRFRIEIRKGSFLHGGTFIKHSRILRQILFDVKHLLEG